MSEFKTFPKPEKRVPVQKWGVYRKYEKPIKKFKKDIPVVERQLWTGDPLLEPPYRGHRLDIVSRELYDTVYKRANGKCEYPGCDHNGEEMNHVAGHARKVHEHNLELMCIKHHKVPEGFHAGEEVYLYSMRKYQKWCFDQGYSKDQVRFLLGTKIKKLF